MVSNYIPFLPLSNNPPASLNKVVVCEHEEVNESHTACTSTSGCGDQIFQRCIISYGLKQVLVNNVESTCVTYNGE